MSGVGQQMMSEVMGEAVLEEEWTFETSTNPSAWSRAAERQHSAEVTLFDCSWLTAEVVDSLADHQQDWIGMLQPDWKLELYNLNLLGIKDTKGSLNHSRLSVADLVFLIRQSQHQPLTIFHQEHWGYTCCLQIAGLGRVRLVVCFDNSHCFGRYAGFVTNRLDWSPRHIVAHWIRHHPATDLYARNPTFKFSPEDSLQPV